MSLPMPAKWIAVTGILLIPSLVSAKPDDAKAYDAFYSTTAMHNIQINLTPENWKTLQPAMRRGGFPGGPGGPGFQEEEPEPQDKKGKKVKTKKSASRMAVEFPIVKAGVVVDGHDTDAEIRFKGNSTYMMTQNSVKKSFKVDISKAKNTDFMGGARKFNLNCNAADASQMREAIAYGVFRSAGIPSCKTTFARVYLNVPGQFAKKYLGLYTVVEQVDKQFLTRHFASSKGLLLKPSQARGGLPYLGEDWANYERSYTPHTEVDPEAAKRVIAYARLVNRGNDAEFKSQISQYMDVDKFLRFLAATTVTVNLDSFLAMGQNFYLYLDPKDNRFVWMPWDLNMAFGGFPMSGSQEQQITLSLDKPYAGENKLVERLLADSVTKARYHAIVKELVNGPAAETSIKKTIAEIRAIIQPAVTEESPYARDVFLKDMGETVKVVSTVGAPGGFGPGGPGGPGGFGPAGPGGPGGFGPGGPGGIGPGGPGGPGGFGPGGPGGPGGFGPGGPGGFGPGGGQGRRGGPGGGPGGFGATVPLPTFVTKRAASVRDQLAGKEAGFTPRGGGPGGPGGPGGFGPGRPGGFGPGGPGDRP